MAGVSQCCSAYCWVSHRRAFSGHRYPAAARKLIEQFCIEAGGPCVYCGDSMERAIRVWELTRSDFNALAEDLQVAMTAEGISIPAQNRLLARLAHIRRQIIDR
ncbi:hypothetical protein [Stutzerimonas xanthomarina]|uniref:globin domain-containing protein n=1 Tax=Stutzerimonas xanthomarina TaxID=271420 RepID=UPI003AA9C3C9